MNALLGKWVSVEGMNVKIGFLRTDCDAGVVSPHFDTRDKSGRTRPLLVRLSDLSIIRRLETGEDYDAAVLAVKPR